MSLPYLPWSPICICRETCKCIGVFAIRSLNLFNFVFFWGCLMQVALVSRLKHENVVELIGYCLDGPLRVLAYEFATMGSLHDILHGGHFFTFISNQMLDNCGFWTCSLEWQRWCPSGYGHNKISSHGPMHKSHVFCGWFEKPMTSPITESKFFKHLV